MSARSAFSSHPVVAHAAGECVGALVEAGVHGPDLALVVVTPSLSSTLRDITGLVRTVLSPQVLVGVASAGVTYGEERVLDAPAVGVMTWTAQDPTTTVHALRCADVDELGVAVSAVPGADTLVLFADPFSMSPALLLERLSGDDVPPVLVGGLLAGSSRVGGNRMVLDDGEYDSGAVGVLLQRSGTVALECNGGALVGEVLDASIDEAGALVALSGTSAVGRAVTMLAELGIELDLLDALRHGVLRVCRVDDAVASPTLERVTALHVIEVDADTGVLTVRPRLHEGDRVVFQVVDECSAVADLQRRFGDVGWPDGEHGVLVVGDVADRAGVAPTDGVSAAVTEVLGRAALGVLTSGVLVRRRVAALGAEVVAVNLIGFGGPSRG